jgi:predicted nucleic acid-binding protein
MFMGKHLNICQSQYKMSFNAILDLFKSLQCIKRKYPMIASHFAYLQKCEGKPDAESKEVDCFKKWLHQNPNIPDIDQPFYKSKTIIDFGNVNKFAPTNVVEEFRDNLLKIKHIMSSSSPHNADDERHDVVTSALAQLEDNPTFSGLIDDVKSTVLDMDMSNPMSILGNKNFLKLIKTITQKMKSGELTESELTSTVNSVIDSVKGDMDPSMLEVIKTALDVMSAAEQGQQPDIMKLFQQIQMIDFKK